MRFLLDINVLIALMDPDHAFHERAHQWWRGSGEAGWASCPLTENGLIRIMASASYSDAPSFTVPDLARAFRTFASNTDHAFWSDSISVTDDARFRHERILSSKHLTDLYLLALAAENGGCLATFDGSIPAGAVSGMRPDQLHVLS